MPLSVKDGMGAWVKDFQKSDAPQFKGKTDKERREMAIAAYMSAKRGDKNEATDKPPFDPDPPKPKAKNSDNTPTSPMSRARQLARQARDRNQKKDEGYVSDAQRKAVWANRADGGKGHPDKKNESTEYVEETYKTPAEADAYNTGKKAVAKRVSYDDNPHKKGSKEHTAWSRGHNDARASLIAKRHTKESVELDEAKDIYASAAKELKTYADKRGGMDKKDFHTAAKHIENIGRANIMNKGQHLAQLSKHLRDLDTSPREKVLSVLHNHGHKVGDFMPGAKMRRESVEQLDELSPATHKSYQAKAFSNAALGMAKKRMGTMSTKDAYDNEKKRYKGIDTSKYLNRKQHGIKDGVEEAGSPERYKMIKKAGDKYNKEKKKAERDAMKAMSKDKDMMGEATYGTQAQRMMSPLQKARQDKEKADRDRDGKLKSTALPMRKKNEENVEENNSAPQTAAHRRAMMVGVNRSKRMQDNEKARQALKDPSHNPAWANSKSKTEETVSELKKSTLGSYIKKASQDAASKAYSAASAAKDNNPEKGGKDFSKSMKRLRGIDTATKKLTKEDIDEAKSFDQKFRDHLKFSLSKSPAVQAYMKKRRDDRDARHAKQDPAAVKKNYGPAVIPPGTAYNKASKRGMNPSQAANAVSTAFKNRAKGGKLPK